MDALIPFTTSGSLVDIVDKKVLIVLRDGRKLIGVLRSYDQYANLVLEAAMERIYHGLQWAQIPRGLFLVRGENVVLLGEVDLDLEDEVPLREAPWQEVYGKIQAEKNQAKKAQPVKDRELHKLGFTVEGQEGDAY
ncbi:hypothetical protein NliqN6_6214 [Naganishia liquefaciens]|uniref:U6 snRNA-associated Sm-like protein LSm1 n=1 Tax=Naganishia liquefaciens TaxID=104408 RepID=A0A8H3TZ65_9TREE|nr:hypothetical protein NliqN6_6214 [Naganishia liquefaciens]